MVKDTAIVTMEGE